MRFFFLLQTRKKIDRKAEVCLFPILRFLIQFNLYYEVEPLDSQKSVGLHIERLLQYVSHDI